MLTDSDQFHQTSFFGTDIIEQLDPNEPLVILAKAIPWKTFDDAFAARYSVTKGRPSLPIRLLVGLMILKQLDNLSDESVVRHWKQNPYYQYFCGMKNFHTKNPCHATELVHFRKRIGPDGVEKIFQMSVALHGKAVEEETVNVDTTVQEKAITYPTDGKLAIKMINRLHKIAKTHNIQQRRTFTKEVKALRLKLRFFRHVKKRSSAKKAVKRLRTIVGILMRELIRKLPEDVLTHYQDDFALYEIVRTQKKKDKNKIYSLHEPTVYCVAKGKDHKPYEYGAKASIVATAKGGIILSATSHEKSIADVNTLDEVLSKATEVRRTKIVNAVCDRGYRGRTDINGTKIILPKTPLKRDSRYQRDKKRAICRRRAAIEPLIGHLKSSYRLARNYLKGCQGDKINLMMSACAWNLRKWVIGVLDALFCAQRMTKTAVKPLFFSLLQVTWMICRLIHIDLYPSYRR